MNTSLNPPRILLATLLGWTLTTHADSLIIENDLTVNGEVTATSLILPDGTVLAGSVDITSAVGVDTTAGESLVVSDSLGNVNLSGSVSVTRLIAANGLTLGNGSGPEVAGAIRFNDTDPQNIYFEAYNGTAWKRLDLNPNELIAADTLSLVGNTLFFNYEDGSFDTVDLSPVVPEVTALTVPGDSATEVVKVEASGTLVVGEGTEDTVESAALHVKGATVIEGDLIVNGLTRRGDVYMGQFGVGADQGF